MAAAISILVLGHVNIFGASPNYTLTNTPKPIETSSVTTQPPITSTHASVRQNNILPSDYTYTPGIGTHRLYTYSRSWHDAQEKCRSDGADLIIINSDAEVEIVKQLLNVSRRTDTVSWIGANDLDKEGQFVTIHGESLARAGFDSWEKGEPNNVGGNEDCVAINAAGKLYDLACSTSYPVFTCELN